MYDNIILGENAMFSTDSDEFGINNNVIVVGSSGSGKTMSIIEPCLLNTYNSSLVVTISKKKLADKYSSVFRRRGYDVQYLDFVEPMQSTVVYDPLQFITSESDITNLAAAIVKANPQLERSKADPYWTDTAISLLTFEISYCLIGIENSTFADVVQFNRDLTISEGSGIVTTMDSKVAEFFSKYPGFDLARNCWNTFIKTPYKTASCIYSTLNSALDTVFIPDLCEMMKVKKNIRMEDISFRKTVLFIRTSAVNPATHTFVNLFYGQLFKSLYEFAEEQPDGQLPIPTRVIADDFAVGSRILDFQDYIAIFREKRISTMLLLQSESQLVNMYGENNTATIINCSDTYVFLGGNDLYTCERISRRLNKSLDEVLYMPVGKEFIFRRGQRPIITKRYDITSDREYKIISKMYDELVAEKNESKTGR